MLGKRVKYNKTSRKTERKTGWTGEWWSFLALAATPQGKVTRKGNLIRDNLLVFTFFYDERWFENKAKKVDCFY